MRQVVLDTETTGLDPAQGHRIIEIGAIELINRRDSGNRYHHYLQPDREIDAGAMEVHGITHEFLADKPRFSDVVEDLLGLIKGAELIIHNASFDVSFLDAELLRLGAEWGAIGDYCNVFDTLVLARQLHPGQGCSLDALCKRYSIDNSQRERHGALLDAEILADVYLAMTGGQASLSLEGSHAHAGRQAWMMRRVSSDRPRLKVIRPSPAELEAHAKCVQALEQKSGRCFWKELDNNAALTSDG
jgi:DNA polymerase III subunit epsilon